ncbi:MAG: DUF6351 family protein [Gammaproteobacteria bacterium]|nr:DUF6351 family protein [Gammaproteobacteria bacterium]MDD9895374.1 DUF6351 family protein [Gammaproteobacteria bacterium]
MHNQIRASLFLIAIVASACSTDEPIATAGSVAIEADRSPISLETLSTKSWLVTGGDVLVEVAAIDGINMDSVRLELNGADISQQFLAVSSQRKQALLVGLPEGESILTATIPGTADSETLSIFNYPISGPIISGPHEQPFYCQSEEFQLVNGEFLGAALDTDCTVATRVDYVYWSVENESFQPISALSAENSDDLGMITLDNSEVLPYIVRVETGTVNRAIYEIAMLHQSPQERIDPWSRSANWNGKLIYTHGGGCRSGWHQQGNRTGGVMREGLFAQGYAVVSSSLNVFGQNCNDLLASETHIMVKERFIEHYGVPEFTIATGASGGSYQSHQTADNYPGVFDGIIVALSFPDVTSATIFTVADSRLLNYYFTEVNPESFTLEQQREIAGYGSYASIANLARGAARLDPIYQIDTPLEEQGGEVSIPALETQLYDSTAPQGIRATVYDHTVNVYGLAEGLFTAQRPLDNVGVQYGLAALNNGVITPQQFIDLNRDIGGFDRDMNHVAERHRADSQARKRALESGRILNGGAGLAYTPIIDYRTYLDHAENGDIHMLIHQFSTRQRLLNENGHAANHVMQIGGLWGFDEEAPDLGELFRQMDRWITNIQADSSDSTPAEKVIANKPSSLTDACWDNSGEERIKIEEEQTFRGSSRCNELYPAYPTPRHVAGAPLANNIVSCQLRPINSADYAVGFTREQYAELDQVFSQGVCDWSRGDVSAATHQGAWASFGPSPINKLYETGN